MNELLICGQHRSGKTSALIAVAKFQQALGQSGIVLIAPQIDMRGPLYSAGLPRSVRVMTPADALTLLRGARPKTVLVDEWDAIHPEFQEQLGALCRAIGVRFLVRAVG